MQRSELYEECDNSKEFFTYSCTSIFSISNLLLLFFYSNVCTENLQKMNSDQIYEIHPCKILIQKRKINFAFQRN